MPTPLGLGNGTRNRVPQKPLDFRGNGEDFVIGDFNP